MLLLIADEDFDNHIVRGLLRRKPNLDIVRVQEVGLASAPDDQVLEWAAQENRVLLTHDVSTMTHYAYERIRIGKKMVGVIEVAQSIAIGAAIDDILFLAEICDRGELENQVFYLPLK